MEKKWLQVAALSILLMQAEANLLDVTTEVQLSQKQCYLLEGKERTEVILSPNNITAEILKQQTEIQKLNEALRKEKIPLYSGAKHQKAQTSNWISDLLYGILQNISIDLDQMLTRQHELLNILAHATALTNTANNMENTPVNTPDILRPMATIKTSDKKSLGRRFHVDFMKAIALNLDDKINKALSHAPTTISEKVLKRNQIMLESQLKKAFKYKTKQQISIGFPKNLSPTTFINGFSNITKSVAQTSTLLKIIMFTKKNILYQLNNYFNYEKSKTGSLNLKGKRAISAIAAKLLVGIVAKKAAKVAKKKIKQLITAREPTTHKLPRYESTEKRGIEAFIPALADARTADQRIGLQSRTYENFDAVRQSQLTLAAALWESERQKRKVQHLTKAQNEQIEIAKTVFNQQLPTNLLFKMAATSTHNKVSAKQQGDQFKITYEYHTTAKYLPTFDITTLPFSMDNVTYTMRLPTKIALTDKGDYNIVNPHIQCGHDCLCASDTPQNKIDECVTEILTEKFSSNNGNPEKCISHISEAESINARAIRFKNDHFSVFSKQKTAATISCGNHQLDKQLKAGLNRIEIPLGCTLKTPFIKMTNNEVSLETNPLTRAQNIVNDITKLGIAFKELTQNKDDNMAKKLPSIKSILSKQKLLADKISEATKINLDTIIGLAATVGILLIINISLIITNKTCGCPANGNNRNKANDHDSESHNLSLLTEHAYANHEPAQSESGRRTQEDWRSNYSINTQ